RHTVPLTARRTVLLTATSTVPLTVMSTVPLTVTGPAFGLPTEAIQPWIASSIFLNPPSCPFSRLTFSRKNRRPSPASAHSCPLAPRPLRARPETLGTALRPIRIIPHRGVDDDCGRTDGNRSGSIGTTVSRAG